MTDDFETHPVGTGKRLEALMECYSITKEFEERCNRGQIRSRHTKARCEISNRVVEELMAEGEE